MLSRRNTKVGVSILAALVWVGAITLFIAREPDPGATTPRELRERLALALTAHNSDALGELLNYPGSGASDFAEDYVAVLSDNGVHDLTVRLVPDEQAPRTATVTGILGSGGQFSYALAVASDKGRWKVAFTPPLP